MTQWASRESLRRVSRERLKTIKQVDAAIAAALPEPSVEAWTDEDMESEHNFLIRTGWSIRGIEPPAVPRPRSPLGMTRSERLQAAKARLLGSH